MSASVGMERPEPKRNSRKLLAGMLDFSTESGEVVACCANKSAPAAISAAPWSSAIGGESLVHLIPGETSFEPLSHCRLHVPFLVVICRRCRSCMMHAFGLGMARDISDLLIVYAVSWDVVSESRQSDWVVGFLTPGNIDHLIRLLPNGQLLGATFHQAS